MTRTAQVTISCESAKDRPLARWLSAQIKQALTLLNGPLEEVSIALVGAHTMSRLHERFLQIKGATDVLTFESDRDSKNRVTAGEIVICVPYARKSAAENGVDLRREALLYAIHGTLHLCGYDDRTRRDFSRMHAKEDEILTAMGIGPVFAPTSTLQASRRSSKSTRSGTHKGRS
jgi:probable rRNA maturation factor